MKITLSTLALVGSLFVLSISNATAKSVTEKAVQIDSIPWVKKSPMKFCEYDLKYPQIRALANKSIESKLNRYMKSEILASVRDMAECDRDGNDSRGYGTAKKATSAPSKPDLEQGDFTVAVNSKGILSIEYDSATFGAGSVYGRPAKGITVNVNTGRIYRYSDLFKPGSNYVPKMNQLIYDKLKTSYLETSGIPKSKEEAESDADDFKASLESFKSNSKSSGKNERDKYSFSLRENELRILDIFDTHAKRAVQVTVKPSEIKDLINLSGPLHVLANE
jgi:hypothetical protein